MEKREHTVEKLYAPKRIDAYLAGLWEGEISRSELKRAMEEGRVRLNGKPARPRDAVEVGDRIEATLDVRGPSTLMPEKRELSVIFEDDSFMVVDKPVGMTVHPAPGSREGTLVHALLGRGSALSSMGGDERPGIVHRLDKETSGLILVAKTNRAHKALASQLAERTLSKTYLALVKGRVEYEEGHLDAPIGHDPKQRLKMAVVRGAKGRPAETRYRVLERFRHATLLEVRLVTGRTHQIRVHMAELGHPVLGDRLYGTAGEYPRMGLHAWKIGLSHPKTGKLMAFESPVPPAFKEMIDRLEK